jgi:hypothetical protein
MIIQDAKTPPLRPWIINICEMCPERYECENADAPICEKRNTENERH